MRSWKAGVFFAFACAVAGCGPAGDTAKGGVGGGTAPAGKDKALPLVAFVQANSLDPWRQVFDAETAAAAQKHASEFKYEAQSAKDDPNRQIDLIDTYMLKSPKVLLISPAKETVQGAVEKAHDAGVAVILLDRAVPGEKYAALVGGDNVQIGREAGQHIVERLGGKGTVLMIQGLAGATATEERRKGAMESFAKAPGIKVIQGNDCKYQRQPARAYMESFLQRGEAVDAVYAHNDEMAIGAFLAWDAQAQKGKKPLFVGVDACQQEVVEMIRDGKLDATFKYPVPGPKGIEIAAEILKGNMPKEKRVVLPTEKITRENAEAYLAANPNLAK